MESIAQIDREGNTFKERYIKKLWKEVREDFYGDLKIEQKIFLKGLLEGSLREERDNLIGCEYWEHDGKRTNNRNGHYLRGLITSLGYIEGLKVPRVRVGGITFKTIERYKQRAKDIDRMVFDMFLHGVATRRVKEVLEPLIGANCISPTTVSNITKALDREVLKYHNRKIADEYKYLILDGIYIKTKSPVHKVKRCILVCYGIKGDGKRELIDFSLSKKGESQESWENFLNRLYHRGLEGKALQLISVDGNKGLYNAVRFVYPVAKIQRCWVHKLRNIANRCPRKIQEEVIKGARAIYNQEDRKSAKKAYKEWEGKWREKFPKVVECLEEDLEDLLSFYEEPKEYWKRLRTTNAIERVFREVRRRIRPMSCFQNRSSVERIIFAIFYRQNKIWSC